MEKRGLKRFRKRLQLRFGQDSSSKVGFTSDISPQGFFIHSALVLPPQTRLQIELSPPGGAEAVLIEGRVVWAKKVPPNLLRLTKGGMGVRIIRFLTGEEVYSDLCNSFNPS